MKKNLIVLTGILLIIPQAYLFADDMKMMGPPPNGDMKPNMNGGMMQGGDQWGKPMEGNMMMKPQDGQMEKPPMNQYNPFDAQSTSKMIQPTGGSQMLPPFGNQGSSPLDQIQFNPPPGMQKSGDEYQKNYKKDDQWKMPMDGSGQMMPQFGKEGYDQIQFNPPPGVQKGGDDYQKNYRKDDQWKKSKDGSGQMMPPMNGSGMMNMMKRSPMNGTGQWMPPMNGSGEWDKKQMMNSGAMAERLAKEIATRKMIVAELKKAGADVSGFTDEVISDGQAFWKLAETFKSFKEKIEANKKALQEDVKKSENKDENEVKYEDQSQEKMNSHQEKKQANMRPALTEKARKTLQDKLDKIPSEKRDTLLPKMLKAAQSQLDVAKEKGNKTLIRKLEAIVEIIQDEIDSSDDNSLFESLMAQ